MYGGLYFFTPVPPEKELSALGRALEARIGGLFSMMCILAQGAESVSSNVGQEASWRLVCFIFRESCARKQMAVNGSMVRAS